MKSNMFIMKFFIFLFIYLQSIMTCRTKEISTELKNIQVKLFIKERMIYFLVAYKS